MTRRRALTACRQALSRQDARDRRRLVGRWKFLDGYRFTVLGVSAGRVIISDAGARYFHPASVIAHLADRRLILYLGR